ncbi:MAG: NAD-dependent epimerase/dehydratase family protein [Chloroflexi bacterium]|nr:NAD-dependent epimerase/dehydratase family protein [Chloroflexota bacterium]
MQEFANTNVLVTGGAGFVGSNLVHRLLTANTHTIHIVDNLLSAERVNIPSDPRIRFTEGSIADDRVLEKLYDEYDFIFHLSTYHGNQSSIHNPLADHDNNLLTTLKLLERVKHFQRLKKWVYAGAGCAVAEKTFDQAYATSEDAPVSLHMDSPYSISKIVGEYYAVYYHARYNVPTVRARFQNVYGPGEILGAGQWRGTPATVWRNVIPTFIYKSLRRAALPVEGGGEATRDFIFVQDIVSGLILCALQGTAGDVYNLASGVETSILNLAQLINEMTGNSTPLKILPARGWDHSGKRYGSPVKSKREIGFEAKTNLRAGLLKTIEWTREHMEMIETCIQRHSLLMRENERAHQNTFA